MVAGCATIAASMLDRRRDHPPPARATDDVDAIYDGLPGPRDPALDRRPSPYTREHAIELPRARRAPSARPAGRSRSSPRRRRRRCSARFSLMELDQRAGLRRDRLLGGQRGARGRASRRGRSTLLRDCGADELGLDADRAADPRGQRALARVAERTGFLDTGERRTAPRQRGRDRTATTWSTPGAPRRASSVRRAIASQP